MQCTDVTGALLTRQCTGSKQHALGSCDEPDLKPLQKYEWNCSCCDKAGKRVMHRVNRDCSTAAVQRCFGISKVQVAKLSCVSRLQHQLDCTVQQSLALDTSLPGGQGSDLVYLCEAFSLHYHVAWKKVVLLACLSWQQANLQHAALSADFC